MGEPAAIRNARPEDRRALAELWLDLIDYHRSLDPHYPVPDGIRGMIREEIERGFGDAACRIAVAAPGPDDAGERLLGFVFAEAPTRGGGAASAEGRDDDEVGWIHELWVEPAAREQGVGSALIEAARGFLERAQASRVAVRVESANTAGLRFWARHGLRERARVFEAPLALEGPPALEGRGRRE